MLDCIGNVKHGLILRHSSQYSNAFLINSFLFFPRWLFIVFENSYLCQWVTHYSSPMRLWVFCVIVVCVICVARCYAHFWTFCCLFLLGNFVFCVCGFLSLVKFVVCCFVEGSPHLWAIVWRMTLNHFEYFRVVHVFPRAAIWLVRGRDTKFVENSFVLLSLQERKETKRFKRLGKSETKFENLLVWLLKEMRFLKKSGFVTKMDTAGFKPSFRYFLWFWSSSGE